VAGAVYTASDSVFIAVGAKGRAAVSRAVCHSRSNVEMPGDVPPATFRGARLVFFVGRFAPATVGGLEARLSA
jgi:hypothetical protein